MSEGLRDRRVNNTEHPCERERKRDWELLYRLVSWKETVLHNTKHNKVCISNGDCTCSSREQTTIRKIGPHLMIPLSNNDMTMVLDVAY